MSKKIFSTQMQLVYVAFHGKPKTMLEVSRETKIERANVCRYVCNMLKSREIALCREGKCPISGYKAGFYSTDRNYFPKENWQQMSLFDVETMIGGAV